MVKQTQPSDTVLLEKLLSAPGEGVFFVDEKGRFSSINPGFTRILGYTAEDVVRMTFSDLRHDLSREAEFFKKRARDYGLYFFYLSETRPMPCRSSCVRC